MASANLSWRVAVANRSVLLAFSGIFLLATTLVVALFSYAAAVTQSSLRDVFAQAPPSSRILTVQAAVDGREAFERRDNRVTSALDDAFAAVGVMVHRGGTSVSYGFPAAAGNEVEDLAKFAFYDGLRSHAQLIRGDWPDGDVAGPVEVALPALAARTLHLRPGDDVELDNRSTGKSVTVTVSGTFAVDGPDQAYWVNDDLAVDGVQPGSTFTTFGPLVVPRSTFLERFGADATAQWRAVPHFQTVTTTDLAVLQGTVPALGDSASRGTVGSDVLVDSELDALLASVDRPLLVLRSTILVLALLLAMLAISTLLLSTRLVTEHRAAQMQQMRARGMSAVQLAATTVRETLVLIVPAALLAPWLAQLLLDIATGIGLLGENGSLAGAPSRLESWLLSAAMVVLSCTALVARVVGAGSRGVAERRFHPLASNLQRAGGDVALAVLAGLAYWQLRRYGSPVVSAAAGQLSVDPLLLLAPAVLLLAGAVLVLRFVPLLVRAGDGVAGRARGVVAALGIWQLSRRARVHIRPATVLALATAIGVFLLVYAGSWVRSSQDQTQFRTGADLRLTSVPTGVTARQLGGLPGVDAVTPVVRDRWSFGGLDTELVGLDTGAAGDVLLLRPDLADRPLTELTRPLAEGRPVGLMLAAPSAVDTLVIPMRIDTDQRARVTADVFAVVRDDIGLLHRVALGPVPADGRSRELVVDVHPTARPRSVVAVEVRPDEAADNPLDVRLSTPRANDAAGEDLGPLEMPATSHWRLTFEHSAQTPPRGHITATHRASNQRHSLLRARLDAGCCDPVTFAFVLDDRFSTRDRALPALVDDELADALGNADTFVMDFRGAVLRLRAHAVVDGVPSVDPSQSAGVVVDLASLASALYRQTGETLTVDEWLLSTVAGATDDTMAALRTEDSLAGVTALPSGGVGAADPLSAGAVGAMGIGTLASALFASIGFALGSLVSVRGRRRELLTLHAMGVGRALAARLVLVEQTVVVALGLGVGVLVGMLVARLVVPLVTLTPTATAPFPAVIVVQPWGAIGVFVLSVVVAASVIVGGVLSRQDFAGSPLTDRREYG